MKDRPLNVAFIWHMHQPFYKDTVTNVVVMPWVRLHAIKDYYDMVAILDDHPSLKQVFNLVPSLIQQIKDYIRGGIIDKYLEITLKPASELSLAEKAFVLERFCEVSWHKRVASHPHYLELVRKKESLFTGDVLPVEEFSEDEYRDLQVWFNLSWFDPHIVKSDRELLRLMDKGGGFTEEEKKVVVGKQFEIMKKILPKYREMQEKGQVEIMVSPFYHPVLPLLCDTASATVALPEISLPNFRYAYPQDALEQVMSGVRVYRKNFGRRPLGLWCPELAVGEGILNVLYETGISWIVADEEILAKSVGEDIKRDSYGNAENPDFIYKPYLLERGKNRINIIFRDRLLSDLISFAYHSRPAEQAAGELVRRLREIAYRLGDLREKHLVTIALDGENCWEYYDNDGHDFLKVLYSKLEKDPLIKLVRVCDFLNAHPPKENIPWLFTGSWVHGNLGAWIGGPYHNKAWDYLALTREFLAKTEKEVLTRIRRGRLSAARREMFIAEGSDWLWWFSHYHDSGMDELWDRQFRLHLRLVYRLLKKTPPAYLFTPVLGTTFEIPFTVPRGPILPVIDGRVTSENEWANAGYCDVTSHPRRMAKAEGLLRRLVYGYDSQDIYFRIDPTIELEELRLAGVEFSIYLSCPRAEDVTSLTRYGQASPLLSELGFALAYELRFVCDKKGPRVTLSKVGKEGKWVEVFEATEKACDQVVEVKVPLSKLGLSSGDKVSLALVVAKEALEVERIPVQGLISLEIEKFPSRFPDTDLMINLRRG